jgi:flagellar biosynthesis GTPase FlhF
MKDVIDGYIKDNEQVRRTLKAAVKLEGGTVKEYRKAIDIVMDGFKFSLRGGIYKEDWTVNQNISVKEVLDNLIRYLDRRLTETSQRYNKDRQKRQAQQPKYQEEIMGKNLLTFLKQLRQQNQNQQQNQQPQKQTQPQKQQTNNQPQHQKQLTNQKLTNQNQPSINNQQNLQDNQPTREDNQQEQTRDQQEQYYLQDYIPRPKMRL